MERSTIRGSASATCQGSLAALIVTLPVLLLTVFAQRQIVAGLTAGAVKGG
jgi:ABC-type glycerol-3-phosphate transport system permease component